MGMGKDAKCKEKVRDARPTDWGSRPLQTASLISAATGNIRTYVTGRYDEYGVLPVLKATTTTSWWLLAIWQCRMVSNHYTCFRVKSVIVNVGGYGSQQAPLGGRTYGKRTTKHKQLCQDVFSAIKTNKLSIIQSKAMMKKLMIQNQVPLSMAGTHPKHDLPAYPNK